MRQHLKEGERQGVVAKSAMVPGDPCASVRLSRPFLCSLVRGLHGGHSRCKLLDNQQTFLVNAFRALPCPWQLMPACGFCTNPFRQSGSHAAWERSVSCNHHKQQPPHPCPPLRIELNPCDSPFLSNRQQGCDSHPEHAKWH